MSDSMMSLIRSQQQPDLQAGGVASSDGSPPISAPMAVPQEKAGEKEAALINIGMAMDLIERALPALGSESPEGQKAVSALRSLSGAMGGRRQNVGQLQNAEILQLLQSLPNAGGATPEMKAMAGMPQIPGMAGGGQPQPPMPPMGGNPVPGAGGPTPGMPQ